MDFTQTWYDSKFKNKIDNGGWLHQAEEELKGRVNFLKH